MKAERKGSGRVIAVVAEHTGERIKPVTYETLECARALQQHCEKEIIAVIIGNHISPLATELAQTSGEQVIAIHNAACSSYNSELYKIILSDLFDELDPSYVCIGHTSRGMDYAPGLAVRHSAACITAVEQVERSTRGIDFVRYVWGGKISKRLSTNSRSVILTVQPGAFQLSRTDVQREVRVDVREISYQSNRVSNLGLARDAEDTSTIADADVIVSAGRGIGKRENLALIREVATMFSKAAIGASRTVCDAGWLKQKHQVGVTGATVTPKLYLACGISGAPQHTAGMRGAEFVVAVNSDPDAAIFSEADICIVDNLLEFLPVFLEEHTKTSRKH